MSILFSKQPPLEGLTFDLLEYIQLVDLSGRNFYPNKRGSIYINQSPILQRLGIDESLWGGMSMAFEENFSMVAGNISSIEAYRKRRRQKRQLT